MANRTHHPLDTVKSDSVLLTAKLTGAGAADLVNAESANNGGGEIVSAVRTGAGKYTVTFRRLYPALKFAPAMSFVGTTDGLVAQFASIDVTTGTGALEVYVGSTPTDLATTDTIYLMWLVRNSGRNA